MSDAKVRLSQAAVDLLVVIAETPDLVISGIALTDYHADAGAELIAAGALQPDGFEPVAVSQADHDDTMVSVVWDGEKRRHGYFSPAVGMVDVDDRALCRFRLRPSWLLGWLAGELGFSGVTRPVELVPDRLWDLGDIWLGDRKSERRRTAIYFGRRIAEPGAMLRARNALQSRAGRPPGIILLSSPAVMAEDVALTAVPILMPLAMCAKAGAAAFALDLAIIRTAAHRMKPTQPHSPVQVDAEFRTVRVGDREFRFGGDKQRQVVKYLHGTWDSGKGRVSAAQMFSDLEFSETTRLRDLFKGNPDWKDLIGYENGACWLRCDELLVLE
jgi:hypothetical protein